MGLPNIPGVLTEVDLESSLGVVRLPDVLTDLAACSRNYYCVATSYNDDVGIVNDLALSTVAGELYTLEGRTPLNCEPLG